METNTSRFNIPKRYLSTAVVGATLLFSASSAAELIDFDSYTYDSETNLSWLDTNQTKQKSYNDIQSEFERGGLFDGWRFATSSELDELIVGELGFTPGNYYSAGTYTGLRSVIDLLGYTYGGTAGAGNEYGFIVGYVDSTGFDDGTGSNDALARQIGFKEEPNGGAPAYAWGGYFRPDNDYYYNRDKDLAGWQTGAFLVKEGADDPLPAWLVEPDPAMTTPVFNTGGTNQPTPIAIQPIATNVSEPGAFSLFALMLSGLAARRIKNKRR